ncbi:uncharacterized protein METZ01_LOCUS220683, partial [marine metagenome]
MNRICYSVLLTAIIALAGLQLAGWHDASPHRQIEGEAFAGPISLAPTEIAGRSLNWRIKVAGEETGLIKPDKGRVADPIGAFQRWAREFMDGTADLEEGLRLARARRAVTARLIRDNPRQAIANRVDDDTREALPEAIRAQLEEP